MINLQFDTANQTAWMTLAEGRLYYSTAFTHYLMVLTYMDGTIGDNGTQLAQVLDVVNENQRSTEVVLTTEGLSPAGQYRYEVYGQNSSSNLDPTNVVVVGLVERGTARISDGTTVFNPIEGNNLGQNEIITLD